MSTTGGWHGLLYVDHGVDTRQVFKPDEPVDETVAERVARRLYLDRSPQRSGAYNDSQSNVNLSITVVSAFWPAVHVDLRHSF